MSKIFKKFITSFIAVCILVTGVFAAACNPDPAGEPSDEDPSKDGYIITVLYPDGSPVKASDTGSARKQVRVTLTDDEGTQLLSQQTGVLSDSGIASLDYKIPGEYNIVVINVPEGYDAPEAKTNAEKSKYTVTLVSKVASYEVSVKLPDGSAANGLNVKLVNGETTVASGTTNANGIYASAEIAMGEYDVIVDSPAGKNYGYKPVKTAMSGAPVEIKLFEPVIFTPDDNHKMTDEQYNYWASIVNLEGVITAIRDTDDNYLYTLDAYGSEEKYYILHAEKTGEYTLTFKYDEDENGNPVLVNGNKQGNYVIKFYVNGNYGEENVDMRLTGSENGGSRAQVLSMNAGDDFIFSVSSIDEREHYSVDFVLAYSKLAVTAQASDEGTYTLTYNDIDEAVLAFAPTKSGKYKIYSIDGEHDPRLVLYGLGTNGPAYNNDGTPVGDDNSGEGNNFEYIENVPKDYIGNTYSYHVFIDEAATTNVRVKIDRIGDAEETIITTTDVVAGATLTKQSKQDGTWHWLDDNDAVTEKNGEYFVTVNGTERKVYVAITKNIYETGDVAYSFATTEYMGTAQVRPGEDQSDTPSNQRLNSNLTVYEIGSVTQRYNYTSFIETYAEYCDGDDGVYPMNTELKTFVERYMNAHWTSWVDNPDLNNPPKFLPFACGYFA